MQNPIPTAEPASTTQTQEGAPRVWKIGTLVYTSGGLVVLFCWLLLGDFAWSIRDRSIIPMAQWYLNHLGVRSLLFGLLISSFPALVARSSALNPTATGANEGGAFLSCCSPRRLPRRV